MRRSTSEIKNTLQSAKPEEVSEQKSIGCVPGVSLAREPRSIFHSRGDRLEVRLIHARTSGAAMANDPKQKYTPWRKAFWLIFLAILLTLLLSLIGINVFHAASLHH